MTTFTSGAGPYTLILNVNEVDGSADVGSNTSKVSWSLQMRADSAYCQWNPGPGDFEVRINGGLVWSAENPSLWYGGMGETLTLASGTTTVGHNSDGSKTVYCEGKYIANSTAYYLPNSSTCGGNLTLFTIPRASSFSSISGNTIGGSQTINIDRKSSSFTHTLWYKAGSNGSWVGIGSNYGTSAGWTIPLSLNNQIPNGTSLTLTYCLRTYNGSTQIGSDVYYNYTVYYSGAKPTAGSTSISYSNLFNNKFIANYSSAVINYNGYSGVYGSSIKSAQVIFNGSWKGTTSYNTGKLTAGTHTFQGVVTDSRGNSSYASEQSFTCYQINNPTVSINAYRSDAEGNANPSGTYITIIPTYSAHDPVGGNSIKSNSFTCTSLMTTGTAIESGSKKILSNAAVDSEYVISGTVTDQLGRSSATSIKVGTAFAIWDVRPDEKGMAFGKYSTGANKFEVAWDAYFDRSADIGGGLSFNGIWAPHSQMSGNGDSATYMKLCTLKINSVYANHPFEICYQQRGSRTKTTLTVMFNSSDSRDPDLASFIYQGYCRGAYIVKSATSTWDIYITKSEDWEDIAILYWSNIFNYKITLTRQGANASSVPSGYTKAISFEANQFFPVGAIYLTWNNNNPGNFLGGTWVRMAEGRGLFGIGRSTGRNGIAANVGEHEEFGDWKHKITVDEMPPHNHSIKIPSSTVWSGNGGAAYQLNSRCTDTPTFNYIQNTGGGKDFYIMPPYIGIYVWRRTA